MALPAALVACPIAIALTVGVSTLAVATNRVGTAFAGLAVAAVATLAMAVAARTAIRALAEADQLRVANEQLQRRNADLTKQEFAVEEALEWIDERTQGRLRDLVEEAGDELSALVDVVLDAPGASHAN